MCVNPPTVLWRSQYGRQPGESTGANECPSLVQSVEAGVVPGVSQPNAKTVAGQVEKTTTVVGLAYDSDCYLCAGNRRAGGAQTDKYTNTYVFENDYAALKLDAPNFVDEEDGKGLLVAEGESGICRVICFSPRHDLTLAKMSVEDICAVVDVWNSSVSN